MRSVGQRVEWSENVGALCGNLIFLLLFRTESPAAPYNHSPLSQFLFMRKAPSTKTTLLEGRRFPVSPNVVRLFLRILYVWLNILNAELDIILGNVDGIVVHPTESATLITITLSANETEILDATLHRAEEAINTMESWSSSVDVIKKVMDAVSQIAAVRLMSFPLSFVELISILQLQSYANLAWGLLSKIPEVPVLALLEDAKPKLTFTNFSHGCQALLQQVQRDQNVRTLFVAIRDAFEFAKDADALRNISPESRQAKILEEMLQCVFEIGKFIELYAKHVQVGKPSWHLASVIINL
jgi:hypothetical protein